jgi:hypothetical protein
MDDNREIVAKSVATKVQLMGQACIDFLKPFKKKKDCDAGRNKR